MAIKFGDTSGKAKKSNIDYFKFEDGDNRFRMVGDILARYVYWKKTPDGSKTMSIECLGFNRDEERFDNITKDWFAHYFPDEKCSWSYLVQAIDLKDGKLKVLGLKKKLFEQILALGNKHLGDPTDIENGWDCVVDRSKTGTMAWDVAYTLDQLDSKNRPLTDAEKELLVDMKSIDDLFPIQTPEEQKSFIEKVWFSAQEKEDESEAMKDFEDDIPM